MTRLSLQSLTPRPANTHTHTNIHIHTYSTYTHTQTHAQRHTHRHSWHLSICGITAHTQTQTYLWNPFVHRDIETLQICVCVLTHPITNRYRFQHTRHACTVLQMYVEATCNLIPTHTHTLAHTVLHSHTQFRL